MSDNPEIEAGFTKRRQPQDEWVARLLEKHGLAPDASLAEIEPKAKELWPAAATRHDATELVLGRIVDARELGQNPFLGAIAMTSDPTEAFGGLLLARTIEEIQAEQPDQK
jgi:hypothetical protein